MRHPGYFVLALLGIVTALLIVGQRVIKIEQLPIQSLTQQVEPRSREMEVAEPAPVEAIQARVIDGDTIAIGDERIRLFGIDAPEHDQVCSQAGRPVRCGDEATSQLRALIGSKRVTCEGRNRDRYGRLIATCSVDGNDVGRQMIASGWAVAFRRYSEEYVPEEDAARTARRGLWRGGFQRPIEWRAEH